jgi:hypothetical protein
MVDKNTFVIESVIKVEVNSFRIRSKKGNKKGIEPCPIPFYVPIEITIRLF